MHDEERTTTFPLMLKQGITWVHFGFQHVRNCIRHYIQETVQNKTHIKNGIDNTYNKLYKTMHSRKCRRQYR